jgi:dolichol kinase
VTWLDALPPGGTPAGEAVRAAVVGAAFLLVFAAAEAWRAWGTPEPEWTRKLVHFGGGLVSAALPWVIGSHWTVLALGAAFAGIIGGTKRLGLLRSVHGVSRSSQGGVYFPLAVYLLFLLSSHRPVFYLISVLVLVVSDTMAALVGSRYGRAVYPVEKDSRSLEGSAVFFLTTFLIVHLPLLLLTEMDRAATVVIGVQLALVVTCFEAISVGGNDNVIVPLATYFLLVKMTPKTAEYILVQLAAQAVIIAVVAVVALRFRFMAFSTAVALTLILYGAFSLGGEEWVVAPALGMLAFVAFYLRYRRMREKGTEAYQVGTLFYAGILATLMFLLNNAFETLAPPAWRFPVRDPFYVPYVGIVCAHVAIMFRYLLDLRGLGAGRGRLTAIAAAAVFAFGVIVPVSLAVGARGLTPWGLAMAATISFGSLAAYHGVRTRRWWPRTAHWDARLQALTVLLVTAILLPLHLWSIGAIG